MFLSVFKPGESGICIDAIRAELRLLSPKRGVEEGHPALNSEEGSPVHIPSRRFGFKSSFGGKA